MKLTCKRNISLLLIISMLCSTASALAIKNDDIIIEISNEASTKNNVELSGEIPRIEIGNSEVLSTSSGVSLYNTSSTEQDKLYTENPKYEMITTDEASIPVNRKVSGDGWTSVTDNTTVELNELESTVGNIASVNTSARTISSSPLDASYRIARINSKDSFALSNQTGRTNYIGDNIGEEYIDPMTGNLIVTETDLVLPGVDGHDLNLSRYYSLAQAELYTKTASISTDSKTYALPEGCYVVTEEIYEYGVIEPSTYYYAYSDEDAALAKVREIETRDTCNGLYTYIARCTQSSEGDTITFDYYYTSEISSSSYQTMRNNLGAGWSWSFPSVQVIKDDYDDETETPKAIYYHDGKGNVMEVEYDDSNGCYFTNYVGHDITFDIWELYDASICRTARIDYIVEDSDCTKYYFGPHGEIRSIIDIHGNKIEFDYTYKDYYGIEDWPIIRDITDSVGRNIRFTYTIEGGYSYIKVTVTSPIESEENIEILYNQKMIDITNLDEYYSTEVFLESVEYPNGDVTSYFPAEINGERSYAQPIEFTFADKSFESDYVLNTSGYTNNLVYLLGNIVRPHSNTYYHYDLCERNLGHSGISQAYRITERGDDMLVVDEDSNIIDGYTNNKIQYDYYIDYTGYPYYNSVEDIDEDEYVCGVTEARENATFTREFHKIDEAVLEYKETANYNNPVGNPLIVTSTVEEYNYKIPVLVKKTYSNDSSYTYNSYQYYDISTSQNKTYGKPLLETEEIDYATYNSANRDKHGFSYTYDSNTGFMLSRSWYKSDDTKCTERFYYNSNGRLSSYEAPNGITTEYQYEYTGGKVSKKTSTTLNDTGTTVIVENYTLETAFAFPSTVVKTVTSDNGTTSETTSYTYNLAYGVVTSMTDNDGNTTYYEYDELGRQTRIVYPVYSTYSAYQTKDIKILPIEEFKYSTVYVNYENVILPDEDLILQGIKDSVSYYDVSNVQITDPAALDVETLPITFSAYKKNYYLGTGEIIFSKVLDLIENAAVETTTKYYYDTAANIVVEVDAKGNSTVTQYDGAGREVQITDQFDNFHIIEYNISGDDTGFKALSYFVPSSDENAKQNVVEYTYDILGRTIKEKAYSSYPDASVEVLYEYDFVGNVIGITDANNNLNEDGYTQTNTYDKLNRVISTKNADNEIIQNTYDVFGNIKKQTVTDSNGNESILYHRKYDGQGKIISDTDNSENSNLYEYDDMGRLTILRDKDSKIKSFGYNELGVQDSTSSARVADSLVARNYAFKNPYGPSTVYGVEGTFNEVTGIYHGYFNEISNYFYSPTGNLLEYYSTYTDSTGIDGVLFKPYMYYVYDSTGNVISAEYATLDNSDEKNGFTTHYEYNKNRVSKVQIDGQGERNTDDSVNVQYEYYDDGKLKSVIYPALTDNTILKSEYVYDGLSRLTSLTNYKGTEVLSSYSYTYDSNGNILTVNETVGTTNHNVVYTYDKLNRILTVAGTKGADSYYEYDVRGNRKANFEQIDFLSEENAVYSYSAEDKLNGAQVGSNTTFIDYSANGYRYIKRENSEYPEFYIYDSNGRLHALAKPVTGTNNGSEVIVMYPTTQYVWGPDRVLAKFDALTGNYYYYLYNGHGDVVQIVNTSGIIKNTYDYDVWGNFLKKEETIENHFTYFGQTYDETTGLYYLRARYYDPTTGRFTQQDPAEDGYNWYVYGNQNPITYIDSAGMIAYPGQIHNLVVNKVASLHGLYKEQTINYSFGWGRADLISNDGAVWDVKRDKTNQIAKGVTQVKKYVANEWRNNPGVDLYVGEYIESGSFIETINIDTYYITYRYAGNGVIAYDYYKVTNWDTVASYATSVGISLLSALLYLVSQGAVQLQPT